MSRSAQQILEDARQLSPSERDWLLGELLEDGNSANAEQIEAAWKAEVERRMAEIDAGTAITSSWAEVEASLRTRLAK
jgi:putative addiction module component (TIGR02574 family)